MRRKEERCTGNLTSLFHSLSLVFCSFPTTGRSRARVIGVSHFVCHDVCFVCSLPIFRVPLPGEFRVCRGSSPFFLDMPLPFRAYGTRLRTYTSSYRSFPSYSRGISCVSARERERVSGSISRWVPVFPPMGSPLPSSSSYPLPPWEHHHGGVGCNPGPLRRLSSLLPDPFEVGEGVKWGIPHPPPPHTNTWSRGLKLRLRRQRWQDDGSSLNFVTFANMRFTGIQNGPFQERDEQGWG